jgi:hypothetical protein
MKIFMGSSVVSKEFSDFDLGITFQNLPLSTSKWLVFSQKGVSLHNTKCPRRRVWRVPDTLEELLFEVDGTKMAILYEKEMRMRKLLKKLSELKVNLVVGYLDMNHYNSHRLIANGWGASQITGVPTILISRLNDNVGYSFFTKAKGLKNGVEFLYDVYSFVEVNSSSEQSKKTKRNNGIKGDR